MSAIVINNLTKRASKKRILSDINLEILEGEFFAILGLENSGKTTLAKILFNYLKPSKGTVSIFDMDSVKSTKTIKESVAIVPEEVSFQENVRAMYLLKKTLAFHNLKNEEEIQSLSEYFNFDTRIKINDMNESDKKIFSIINALIVKPRLLIMDDVTKNLDRALVEKIFLHLKKLKEEENLTVLFLTESLVDAQRYCDRAAYIYEGEVQDIEYFKDKISNDKIIKVYESNLDVNIFTGAGAVVLADNSAEKILYYDKDMKVLSNIIAQVGINDYTIEDSSLEDKINAYYVKMKEE